MSDWTQRMDALGAAGRAVAAGASVALLASALLLAPLSLVSAQECIQPNPEGCPVRPGEPVRAALASPDEVHMWLLEVPSVGDIRGVLMDLSADYDLHVFAGDGSPVAESVNEGTEDDRVELPGVEPDVYALYVHSPRGQVTEAPYTLLVELDLGTPATALLAPTAEPAGTLASRGTLIYEASLDGSASDVQPGSRWNIGDRSAADIRFPVGAIEIAIVKPGGNTGVPLNVPGLLRYAAQIDLSVEPGAGVNFFWNIRNSTAEQAANYVVWVDTFNEFLQIVYQPSQPRSVERLSPRAAIPGLQTGRVVSLEALVDDGRYTVFVDGRQVADVSDARLSELTTPAIGAWGVGAGTGTVRVVGARLYRLL